MIVVQLAKTSNLMFGGTANFLVAREYSALATYDQKLALMRCLFEVSATDDAISIAEEGAPKGLLTPWLVFESYLASVSLREAIQ
jgi:hypothetical protein